MGQFEVGVDGSEGGVEIAFPKGDVVFKCRVVCKGVRDGPVIF